MRCEICGHKIPVNQNECPNCGNKTEKGHQISYHVNSSSHEHVKVNHIKKSSLKINSIIKIVIGIISVCLFVNTVLGIIFSVSDDSFEDYIEDIGDNETVSLALQYRDKVQEYLEKKNLHNISYDEHIEDENTLKAKCEFYCSDNVADYTLSFIFSNEIQTELTLKVEMKEADKNMYTSLRNLDVFNEILDKDIANNIKKIREDHKDENREVHFSDYTIIVDEYENFDIDAFEWNHDLQYTIAGNGYRIHK